MIDHHFGNALFILTSDEARKLWELVPDLEFTKIKIFEVGEAISDYQIRCAIFVNYTPDLIVVNSLDERIDSLDKRSTSILIMISIADVRPYWCYSKHYFGSSEAFILQLQRMGKEKLKLLFAMPEL